jgi:uncharacterized membrane protein YfcA
MLSIAPTTIGLLAGASLFAGTVDAIAGGGGLVTVPALLAAGLPPHLALGTNKGQSVWGSAASLVAFWRARRVDRRVAVATFPLGLIGALGGATLVGLIAPATLRPVVLALLVAAAALLVVRKPSREQDTALSARRVVARASALAVAVGVYDGFFGPGTGTFLIVGFVALCGRSLVHASADAKVVNFASNLAAVGVFAATGRVVWEVALPMAAAQLCGGVLGAHLAMRGGARVVRIAVLVVSGALIAKLAWDLAG